MPKTRLFRVTAVLLALLTSVTTPGLAYAHARVHEHISAAHTADVDHQHDTVDDHTADAGDHEHAGDTDHHDAAPTEHRVAGAPSVDRPAHDHEHGHPAIADAAAPRDESRFSGSDAVPSVVPCAAIGPVAILRDVCATALTNALLARPGPPSGPPPNPRAPPAR